MVVSQVLLFCRPPTIAAAGRCAAHREPAPGRMSLVGHLQASRASGGGLLFSVKDRWSGASRTLTLGLAPKPVALIWVDLGAHRAPTSGGPSSVGSARSCSRRPYGRRWLLPQLKMRRS